MVPVQTSRVDECSHLCATLATIFMLIRPTDGSLEACPHGETQPPTEVRGDKTADHESKAMPRESEGKRKSGSILKIGYLLESMSEVIICFQQTLAQA